MLFDIEYHVIVAITTVHYIIMNILIFEARTMALSFMRMLNSGLLFLTLEVS